MLSAMDFYSIVAYLWFSPFSLFSPIFFPITFNPLNWICIFCFCLWYQFMYLIFKCHIGVSIHKVTYKMYIYIYIYKRCVTEWCKNNNSKQRIVTALENEPINLICNNLPVKRDQVSKSACDAPRYHIYWIAKQKKIGQFKWNTTSSHLSKCVM